jgi:hypothetical protein
MNKISTATSSSSIADILERVLDKGVVIAGDIRIKLVDIELLTIQIRLVVCSIEKAKEIGMDWWNTKLDQPAPTTPALDTASELALRLSALEDRVAGIKRTEVLR